MEQIVKKKSYHYQVYEIIKNQIISGKIKSGEKINENGIAQSLGVSRSPVREAMRMLERDELLVAVPGGLIVNPLDIDTIMEIYECRMLLESYAARESVRAMSDEEIRQLEEYVHRSMEYHKNYDFASVVEVNTTFHNMITGCCRNHHLRSMMDRNGMLSLLSRVQEFSCYKRDHQYLEEHLAIVEALKQRNEDLVEARMREHIENDRKFYIEMYEKSSLQSAASL